MPWAEGVAFQCPCGERQCYVAAPPHTITFDGSNVLTLDPSCGFKARGHLPQNWCHFFLKNGQVEMCSDAKCPGGSGEIPMIKV